MVRLADEIVDTYSKPDAADQLYDFHKKVLDSLKINYSVNPILNAFAITANKYGITKELINPFFDSMFMDLSPQKFDKNTYDKYIYGSAEVVGLMCLRVFVDGNDKYYQELSGGAKALGAAYQKVNFLRDMKADYEDLGRIYFPNVEWNEFNDTMKLQIVSDIENDFYQANKTIELLPLSSRRAVRASSYYYHALLDKLRTASTETIKSKRLRVGNFQKIVLLLKAAMKS